MKKAILGPIGLISLAVSAILIVWPCARYASALWEPFTPEAVTLRLWLPPGGKVLNENGPVKVTEVRVQAPTVVRVKDRDAFLAGAAKSDRVEVAFMPGFAISDHSSVACVDACYVAHGREVSYLYWEAPIAPNGENRRGTIRGSDFWVNPDSGTLVWTSVEHPAEERAIVCALIGLGACVASFLAFLVVWGVWAIAASALAGWVARRKPPAIAA